MKEELLLQQWEEQLLTLCKSLWKKQYDGCFISRLKDGNGSILRQEGSLHTVLTKALCYAKSLPLAKHVFPFRVETWWNNKNKGALAVTFYIDLDINDRIKVFQYFAERLNQRGDTTYGKLFTCNGLDSMPEKSQINGLINLDRQQYLGKQKGRHL